MAKIQLSKISEAAHKIAEYAGQDLHHEIFLGYEIVVLVPVHGKSAKAFEPKEIFELTFAHWVLSDAHICGDPDTVNRRLMRYTLTVEEIINYEPEYCHGAIIGPVGDFELLEWNEPVAVSSGRVPDDVLDVLCSHLDENEGNCLAEIYAEAFKSGELPRWDPRILKVVEDACLKFGDGSI
jgi:hypothetical protein